MYNTLEKSEKYIHTVFDISNPANLQWNFQIHFSLELVSRWIWPIQISKICRTRCQTPLYAKFPITENFFPWNQVFSNFFSKSVVFTKFLGKISKSQSRVNFRNFHTAVHCMICTEKSTFFPSIQRLPDILVTFTKFFVKKVWAHCGNYGILLPQFFWRIFRQINVLLKNSTVNWFDEKYFAWQ